MRLVSCFLLAAAMPVTALAAENQWHRAGAAPTQPVPTVVPAPTGGAGELTVYATLAEFETATAGLAIAFENFEERPDQNVSPCYEPVNHQLGQPGTNFLAPTCFQPTELIPGFSIRSDAGYTQGFGTYAIGVNLAGNADVMIGAMSPGLMAIIDFLDAPVAVAMNGYDWQAGSLLTFTVYDADDMVLGSLSLQPVAPNQPVFAGFTSPRPVSRVTVAGAAGASQKIANLRFGGRAGMLVADTGRLEFGAVALGDSSALPVDLTNAGDTPVEVAAITPPAGPFAIDGDTCSGQSLAPGDSCQLTVAYEPPVQQGDRDALAIAAGGGDAAPIDVQLRGRGVLPVLSADPLAIDFGHVAAGDQASEVVQLRNYTAVDIVLFDLGGVAAPFAIGADTCQPRPLTLAPGDSCTIQIEFAPDSDEPAVAGVSVGSSEPSSPLHIALRGNGNDTIFADGFESPP